MLSESETEEEKEEEEWRENAGEAGWNGFATEGAHVSSCVRSRRGGGRFGVND
jgi:hypothetical protein